MSLPVGFGILFGLAFTFVLMWIYYALRRRVDPVSFPDVTSDFLYKEKTLHYAKLFSIIMGGIAAGYTHAWIMQDTLSQMPYLQLLRFAVGWGVVAGIVMIAGLWLIPIPAVLSIMGLDVPVYSEGIRRARASKNFPPHRE